MKKNKSLKLLIPATIIALVCVTPVIVYTSCASETNTKETSNKAANTEDNLSKSYNSTYVNANKNNINDIIKLRSECYNNFNLIYRKTAEINNEYDGNPDNNQLNNECLQVYDLWNQQLNYIYERLETILPNEDFLKLKDDETNWNNNKKSKAKEYAQASGTTTNYKMIYYTKLTELTRDRCYYLLNNYTS